MSNLAAPGALAALSHNQQTVVFAGFTVVFTQDHRHDYLIIETKRTRVVLQTDDRGRVTPHFHRIQNS